MKLKVIGTGSAGNCYVLTDSMNNSIMIDAGINPKKVKQFLNFDLTGINECLITHEHKDHCKYANKINNLGIDVYTNIPEIGSQFKTFKINKVLNLIFFKVLPFLVEHDAVEPVGFIIWSVIDNKKTLFITDSYFVRYKFNDISYLILECNYDDKTLRENEPELNKTYVNRLKQSHMGLNQVIKFVKEQELTPEHLVLIHASGKNFNESNVVNKIDKLLCGTVLTVAKNEMEIVL